MEKILKEYGPFLLAGFILVMLLAVILSGITDEDGNRGIFRIIGAKLDVESADYASYTDFDTYQAEAGKSFPEIAFNGAVGVYTGVMALSDYVKAVDFAGAALPVTFVGLEDISGNDLSGSYNPGTGEITFSEPGIYCLTVSATDSGNRKAVKSISIPVLRGGGET